MAFGKENAQAVARVEQQMASKGLDMDGQPSAEAAEQSSPLSHSAEPVASRPVSGRPAGPSPAAPAAPSPPASASRPGSRPSYSRPSMPPGSTTRPASARPPAMGGVSSVPVRPPAASADRSGSSGTFAPRDMAQEPPLQPPSPDVAGLFDGYVRQVAERSRRPDGLSLRLERLVDEVSDFMGYAAERREAAKVRAAAEPVTWEKRLSDFYAERIRPTRAQSAQTLEDARRKHPGKIVYVQVRQGEPVLQVVDRDSPEAAQAALLDGATVETVAASRTPFVAPRDLFGRQETIQVLDEAHVEAAFAEAAPVSRAPRP